MRHLGRALLLSAVVVVAVLDTACATSFHGDANITPAACATECRRIGGELTAYVFMGRYSTACVCTPPGRTTTADSESAASAGGAVAGVWMQMMSDASRR